MEIPQSVFHQAQQDAFRTVTNSKGGVVWMRVGEGKTRVGLFAAQDITKCPVVLAVTRRAAFYDWEVEIATLQLPYDVVEIEHTPYHAEFKQLTIMLMSCGMWNNANISNLVQHLIDHRQIGCMLLDEGWMYKNPKTKIHIAASRIAGQVPTILMSGSIMPKRDLIDIYGQVVASGKGRLLSKTLTEFRSEFMLGMTADFTTWYPKKGAYQKIIDRIHPFSSIYFPNDRDRRIHNQIRKIKCTEEQSDYFDQLKTTAGIQDKFDVNSMATVTIKAQQISNGWLQLPDGTIEYIESNKIEACCNEVESILLEEKKVVVWCAFRHDIVRLMPFMEEFGKVATLQGGEAFDHTLWSHPSCRVCLATEASGSSVNTFAQVSYAIYFSQDWKWRSLEQSQGRHTRRSSEHDVAHFTFLHTNESLDSKVYYTVRASENTEKGFIRKMDVAQWIRG